MNSSGTLGTHLKSIAQQVRRRWPVAVGGILLGLTLLVPPSVGAQSDGTLPLGVQAGWNSADTDYTRSVAWGDVNGDGYLDLGAGNKGSIKVYLNDKGILRPAATWQDFEIPNDYYSVAWGDVDGDGDLDLAAGGDSFIKVFRNMDGVLAGTAVWQAADAGIVESVAWGDVNGDGRLDLAVGGTSARVYLNTGTALDTTPVWQTGEGTSQYRSVAWGDVNNDGALDLAVAGSPNTRIYLNEGKKLHTIPDWEMELSSSIVSWGDMDGDGNLDLAIAADWDPVYGTGPLVCRNIWGRLPLGPCSQVYDATGWLHSLAWGDADGDGDLDLALAEFPMRGSGKRMIFQNVTGMLESQASWNADDRFDTSSLAWGDMDNDGDLELAAGNEGLNTIYLNEGNVSMILASSSGGASGRGIVAWGDANHDGRLDLVGKNGLYLNNGGVLETESVWSPDDFGEIGDDINSVVWGDANKDGDLDLAVGGSGFVRVYLNEKGMLQTTPAWQSPYSDTVHSVAWGDVDGNGYLDLATGNDGHDVVYLNEAGVLQTAPAWVSADSDNTRSLAWGDVDDDGDLDLVTGNDGSTKLYLNEGGRLQSIPAWRSADSDNVLSMALGDVDGDGYLDLVAGTGDELGGSRGPCKLYHNNSGLFEASASWITGDLASTDGVALGDADGDGDLDLAVAGQPRMWPMGSYFLVVRIYRNVGGRLQIVPAQELKGGLHGRPAVAWGDVDSDGDLDLAVNFGLMSRAIYHNTRHPIARLPNTQAYPAISRPGRTASADFYSVADVLNSRYIRVGYDLYDLEGDPARSITVTHSLDGGGTWQPAVAASGALMSNLTTGLPENYASGNSSPVPIPDLGAATSTLFVPGSQIITDLNVRLNITHTFDADLSVYLRSPNGTSIELFAGVGGAGDNFTDTILDDEASTSVSAGVAPFTGRFRPTASLAAFDGQPANGTWILEARDTVGGHSGGIVSWGIDLEAGAGRHEFVWDTLRSGLFGQSDNAVLRLQVSPQAVHTGISGTYLYTNSVPGPYQALSFSATTFPFRVRGTQVRVLDAAGSGGLERPDAFVYRLPKDQDRGAEPLGGVDKPFRTDRQGYLQGRGVLGLEDRIMAVAPVALTPITPRIEISPTDTILAYHTSFTPTLGGVDAYTITASGVQTLTVSAANPLLLFNLNVALEWDASKDQLYLDQLDEDLKRASEILYDWTDGQAALGRVSIYNDARNQPEVNGFDGWLDSHIRICASNRLRPSAAQGGVISDTLKDTASFIDPTGVQVTNVITYTAGQVRMGPTWNRYGESTGNLGDDWPRALAHELGHYLFFLDDNYLGFELRPDGRKVLTIIPAETVPTQPNRQPCAGAMNDPYRDKFSELHPALGWSESGCKYSLSNWATGRSDWQTVTTFYPQVLAPGATKLVNSGPRTLPLAVTQVSVITATTAMGQPLEVPIFYLDQEGGGTYLAGRDVRTVLYLSGDSQLTDLGRPAVDQVQARGARPGDRLCVYDPGQARIGCEVIKTGDDELILAQVADWRPEIRVSPVTSTTINITVTVPVTDSASIREDLLTGLRARLYPANDSAPITYTIPLTPAVVPAAEGRLVFSGSFPKPVALEPVLEGYVRVWVEGLDPARESIVDYSMGGNPIHLHSRRIHLHSRRIHLHSRRAPAISSDGQAIVFGDGMEYEGDEWILTLQGASSIPNAPPGRTVVGQAYWMEATTNAPDLANTDPSKPTWISFGYLGAEVPPGEETFLKIYYYDVRPAACQPRAAPCWRPLPTELDTEYNMASARTEGEGLYALMSTLEIPLSGPGWNLFAYPVANPITQPVGSALRSIDGYYTVVWGYDPSQPDDPWQAYSPEVVGTPYEPLVNDLKELRFGRGYWLHATEAITLYLGIMPPAAVAGAGIMRMSLPPAAYYGPVARGASAVLGPGLPVTAYVDGKLCGQGLTQEIEGQIVYVTHVAADDGGSLAGCGAAGRTVTFAVNGAPMTTRATWDNTRVWYQPLQARYQFNTFLPIMKR